MRSWTRRHTWLLLSFVGLVLLAACGSAVSELADADPASPEPLPAATAMALGEGAVTDTPAVTPLPTVAEPAAEATATPAASDPAMDEGSVTEDDRPSRLRIVTNDWNTNWGIHSIDYVELLSGGPPRDGIPSIDDPKFIDPEVAAEWLAENEPVIALEIDGQARAYPLQILTWHEIVNDVVADVPVAVTFCPLCNAAITFDRRLDGEVYEFGTSGLLRNSDLVMYDRTTESLWQQLTGEAIVGDLTGRQLDFLPSSLVSFADFWAAYPNGIVLSRDTGYSRSYGRNPYGGYDTIGESPFLFLGEKDPRLPAMERVVNVALDSVDVAYPLSVLSELGVINDRQGGRDLVVFWAAGTSSALGNSVIAQGADVGATGVFDPNLNGQRLTFRWEGDDGRNGRLIMDEQTGSTWNVLGQAIDGPLAGSSLTPIVHGDHFWFAWAAFKPDTSIYQTD